MAVKPTSSTKRGQIDQANSRVVIAAGIAAFVVIFCGVASRALISQASYQNRIISTKRAAVNQLKADVVSAKTLRTAYDQFNGAQTNVLGGSATGSGALDGTNTKIVLDALPSSYDFPALATSLEKLIVSSGMTIVGISGTDDEVAQSQNQSSSKPLPVAMPFQVSVSGDYGKIQSLVSTFEHSIRPIQIQSLKLSGDQSSLTLTVAAQTFYQPAKSLNITTKVVK